MDYPNALQYLEPLIDYERTPAESRQARLFNLDRIRVLLEAVGEPQQRFACVHIAGTKGKGSTAAMSAAILQAAGYRVGLYTSPHLVSFRERIRLDGALIPEERVGALTEQLRPHIDALRGSEQGRPSFFEAYTAMALLYFAEEQADIAVLEAGLGGRLDATNVVTPEVCGIATIALDHVEELGDTLAKIAGEKAGIIKPGVPVVTAPQESEAAAVIRAVAGARGARLICVGHSGDDCEISVSTQAPEAAGQRISVRGRLGRYDELLCPLLGEHQARNAGVAVGMMEVLAEKGYRVDAAAIRAGIERVRWPGRLQVIPGEPNVVLDGAHDAVSARALARALTALFPGVPVTLVLGINSDKDIGGIVEGLGPIAGTVIATASRSPRSAKPADILRALERAAPSAERSSAPNVAGALAQARQAAGERGVVVATGSLYVVGEAMQALGVVPA